MKKNYLVGFEDDMLTINALYKYNTDKSIF